MGMHVIAQETGYDPNRNVMVRWYGKTKNIHISRIPQTPTSMMHVLMTERPSPLRAPLRVSSGPMSAYVSITILTRCMPNSMTSDSGMKIPRSGRPKE